MCRALATEPSQDRPSSLTAAEGEVEVVTTTEVGSTTEGEEEELLSREVQPSTPPPVSRTTAPSGRSTTGAWAWARRPR